MEEVVVVVEKEKEEEEEEERFKTGQEVEVSSDEEGFKGAWFEGTIVESNSKTQFLIEYDTLLADDGKSPLREYIKIPYIRPKPPSLLDSRFFQVNDLVDAFHRDAWWPGVISRALRHYQFLVSFKNPYEQIIFSGFALRFHQDWRHGKWIQPQFQEVEWKDVGALDPKKVKQSRAKRPRRPKKVFKSGDSATGSNKSNNVRSGESEDIVNRGEDSMDLQDKNPTEVHSQLQLALLSETQMSKENNGVDEVNKKRKRGRAKLLLKPEKQTIQKKGKEAPPLPVLLLLPPPPPPPMKSPSEVVHSNENGNIGRTEAVTSPLSIQVQSTPVAKKRGRPFKKPIINSVETAKDSGEKCTGGTTHSKANNDCEIPTLSTEDGISSQTTNHELRVSPGLCAIKSRKETIITQDEEKEEFVGPFQKCSPLWKTIESMEVFERTPQKPHFSSLSNCEEQFREGLAIGCMVTFANTVDRISKLKISDPTSVVERYLETLAELEYHGFNVEIFKSCLKELLAKKVRESQLQEESKKVGSEIAARRLAMKEVENEISEIEAKIKEHKQKHGDVILRKELMDEEISSLQMKNDKIGEDINNVRLKFQNIVASSN